MPAKLERCVEKVMAKGHSKSSAYAICQAAQTTKEIIERTKTRVVVKEAGDTVRWVALASGSFGPDRDGHWVTEKAIQKWVSSFKEQVGVPVRANGEEIVARWRHVGLPDPVTATRGPGLDLGVCDYLTYENHTILFSGTFYDPNVGRAWVSSKERTGVSIGFFHPWDEPKNGLYHTIDIFEVSFLPDDRASYPLTALSVIEGDKHG